MDAVSPTDAGTPTADENGTVTGASRSQEGEQGLKADVGDPTDGSGRSARDRVVRWFRTRARSRRVWLVGGAVAAVAIAFASGTVVGALRPSVPSAPDPTPTDGAITLTQLLDAPQTYADQLPGAIDVPVVLHSSRLVFTNRSLAGDDANTPWNVWAAVGKDSSEICLVASADRIQATAGCYPKDAVLAGRVRLTASSTSGQLDVQVVGGVVRGSVSSDF
ncbi:MAG: hypothetical protein INR72_13905 [Williamsia herbipolensis]|nr:hypothetical protein [Williamsia herbipolensis]